MRSVAKQHCSGTAGTGGSARNLDNLLVQLKKYCSILT